MPGSVMGTFSGMAGVISPVYQPIVDLRSGEPLYFEALARATSRKNHVQLLQFAESYGFIHLLDVAMIDLAAQALRAGPDLRIGVNVSVATIECYTGPLICAVYNHLSLADRFVFEITETVPMSDHAAVATFVGAMKAAGAVVAFDDFGAGYFTYDHIERFRPDVIKLAAELIANRGERAEEIECILAMARKHGMRVVAEAIDSEEKRRDCLKLGIQYAQGFLVGGVSPEPDIVPGASVAEYRPVCVAGCGVMVPLEAAG